MKRLPRSLAKEVLEVIKRYFISVKDYYKENLLSFAIFGSVARGEAKFPGSDIDIFLVIDGIKGSLGERLEEAMNIDRMFRSTKEFENFFRAFKTWPNFQEHILNPKEVEARPPILLDLVLDAVILYDKNDFLKNSLNKLQEKLENLKARRIQLPNGSWMWDLKPNLKFGEVVEI